MSHFAEIKPNGLVVNVICIEPDMINNGSFGDPHKFIQTSYNGNFRNKFAKVGDRYDRTLDMFVPPSPYPSWVLETYEVDDIPRAKWVAPKAKPKSKPNYVWNEELVKWVAPSTEV